MPWESKPIKEDDDIVLFDAPGFPDPKNANEMVAQFQSFVFAQQKDIDSSYKEARWVLQKIGIDIDAPSKIVKERIRLFLAEPKKNKEVRVQVDKCSKAVNMTDTDGNGMMLRDAPIGNCGSERRPVAKVLLDSKDQRKFSANVYISPNDEYGVVSGIEGTILSANITDITALKDILLGNPNPVEGMPGLYASLSKSLNSPQFIYISSLMFQLYPLYHTFINTQYSHSSGPIFLRNITDFNLFDAISFLKDKNTIDFKLSTINNIRKMYPKKKFLLIGDSLLKDPEAYGAAYRKHGDFISCIWIRRVNSSPADNSENRFNDVFSGVPKERYMVFADNDIPRLSKIDVAKGQCK
ncbi:hypothetical protein AMATHDRAFT_144073 [Amanita thiersii Skay4041]|uniref:Phosphatidate phosphatase APP1 catalytic domain-containing protein n=1 Tax=Amanita thiersii Skay4041 TaxID=703135 RepID=A0A2A9NRF3_9AGAR|nr:hypothetical protein AMATHDRAFT_144073 [Amanita thiersii Skay4041]